jgi:2-polyprenyl-3-methyl-5-hydroxy-6-metoxy-1,4-benzoquinol methylase
MAEDSGQSVLSLPASRILPLVPGLTDRLARGMCVLDAGCGRGRIMPRLAELYLNSRFTGIDLSQEAIAYAREPWELTVPGLYGPGPIGDTPCVP